MKRISTRARAPRPAGTNDPSAPSSPGSPPAAAESYDARPLSDLEGRRERHQRETLDRLVRAARTILFGRSLNDVRIVDITEAADVGKGTFFNYFRSKEQLLPPVIVASSTRQIERALEVARSENKDAWQALVNGLREYLCPSVGDWLTYEGNILLAMVANADVRQEISTRLMKNVPVFEALIALGQEQGVIRNDVPAGDLSRVLRSFISGFTINFWIDGVIPTPALVDQSLAELQRLMAPARPQAAASGRQTRPRRRGKITPGRNSGGRSGRA